MTTRSRIGTLLLLVALGALLAGAAYVAFSGSSLEAETGAVSGHLLVAMILGIVFSLVVGVGLMALVFYSSRRGYDEPPDFRAGDGEERR